MDEVLQEFVVLHVLCLPVSWSLVQAFYVYRKRRDTDVLGQDAQLRSHLCSQSKIMETKTSELEGDDRDPTGSGTSVRAAAQTELIASLATSPVGWRR